MNTAWKGEHPHSLHSRHRIELSDNCSLLLGWKKMRWSEQQSFRFSSLLLFRRRTSTRVEKCESLIPITCRAKQISSINRWEMKPSPAWSTRFSLLHLSSLLHFLRVKRRLFRRVVFRLPTRRKSKGRKKGIKNFCSLLVHVLGICRYVPESDLEWWYCRRERKHRKV